MTDTALAALTTVTLSDTSTIKRCGDGRIEFTDADGKMTVEGLPQVILSRIFDALFAIQEAEE